ncbi:MAG TPA: hypothetical protein VN603_05975 [Candidatus Acidoferrales bacterium]|nr:hypothetical protein [Candidatus Acidoferrales bacterium]
MPNIQLKPITCLLVGALVALPTMQLASADEESFVPQFPEGSAVHGNITALQDKYTVDLRDDQGNITTVQLHRGTVIKPLGLTLTPGMEVVITLGSGSTAEKLSAAEIDVPNAPRPDVRPDGWPSFIN